MMKDYSCLCNEVHYQGLVQTIKVAVRQSARTVPAFRDSKNGCIRITIVPLSALADAWLGGGLSDFGKVAEVPINDVCEREFVYKIHPEGSHTIQYVCEDGHIEPVNCYGYSALKTAWASWKRRFEAAERENDLGETFADFQFRQHTQFFTEDNGWSMHEGSVWATVTLDGEEFCRLYVCTSGARSTEDEQCSLVGMAAAQEFFKTAESQIEARGYFQHGIPVVVNFGFISGFTSAQET